MVIETVLEVGGFDALEVTEAGLREGIFFERCSRDRTRRCFDDVRAASVRNLAAQYHLDRPHAEHVARAGAARCGRARRAGRASRPTPSERELLWAAAMLHDVGMAVDYDDHHKHSRYLILNAGLPGFAPREVALIGQTARYHRKGRPACASSRRSRARATRRCSPRCAALLRLAEQLERTPRPDRARTRASRRDDGAVELAARRRRRRHRRAAGRPSARRTCSAGRSTATWRSSLRRELHDLVDAARAVRVLHVHERERA